MQGRVLRTEPLSTASQVDTDSQGGQGITVKTWIIRSAAKSYCNAWLPEPIS